MECIPGVDHRKGNDEEPAHFLNFRETNDVCRMKILFVCLGNICRSPLAEGILREKVSQLGLDWNVDSAGTGHWHIGEPPDPRSVATAQNHGIDITYQRARQFSKSDFDEFDLILTMDKGNYRDVQRLASNKEHANKVKLILDYPHSPSNKEVPDPYWNDDGFEQVFRLLDIATDNVIKEHAEKN